MGSIANGKYAMVGAVSEDPVGYSRVTGLSFWTSNFDSAPLERMRITGGGNVGIGTASPDVFARGYSGRILGISSAGQSAIELNSATGNGAYFDFGVNGTRTASIYSDASSTDFSALGARILSLGTSGAAALVLNTNNAERMRIDASGNVGINSTPSPWSSGYRALQIAGQGAGLFANVTSSQAVLGSNGYYNGTNWIYNNSDTAGQYWIDGNVHKWFNASGGSAGSTISFTERMRIDSSGNLLVGKSSLTNETTTDGFVYYKNASGGGSTLYATNGGNGTAMALSVQADTNAIQFFRSGTLVGSVSLTTTNTAYNTSSDYRLKEIDGPIANSGAYIDALKPVQGSWKADGSRFIGLLAHEVQEVSETPIATGDKDGEKMQAMDYSAPELIANLIAEIQSLRARVAQLEGN